MPKMNSLTLPYYFRNIGSQPATYDNLQAAQPLTANIVVCSPNAILRSNFQPHGHERVDSALQWLAISDEVRHALDGRYQELALWDVAVHNHDIRLHYRDVTQRTTAKHAIDGSIVIEKCDYLEIEFEAQPLKTLEPARKLRCVFGDDAAWGSFVNLTEWRNGYGIRNLIVYPEALPEHFDKISKI